MMLHQSYEKIQNVVATADCTSPRGPYISEVHASIDGYTYFLQTFDDGQFAAVVSANDRGFVLDTLEQLRDTLPPEMQEMIRSHAFHLIHTRPGDMYGAITYDTLTNYRNAIHERYVAQDVFGRQIQFFKLPTDSVLAGMRLFNPVSTAELIEVNFRAWTASEYGPMASLVEIVQNATDTFTFQYRDILINQPDRVRQIGID